MKAVKNVTEGWRTSTGGLLIMATAIAYYVRYEAHLVYCVLSCFIGVGFLIAPDQLRPLFVKTLETIIGFVTSRFKK